MKFMIVLQIVRALIDLIIKDADGDGKLDLFQGGKNEVPKKDE